MSLSDETGVVAAPIASGPSRTLIQELDVVLKSCLNLTLHVVLNPGLPSIGYQPASNKIVVIGIELKPPPTFSLETIQEQGTLQDLRSECTSAARHAGSATIKSMCSRDLKVAPLDVCCTKPVVQNIAKWAVSNSLDALTWSNTSYTAVLKRSKKPGKDCSWPRDIVVCHNDDGSFDLWDCFADLNPLICN